MIHKVIIEEKIKRPFTGYSHDGFWELFPNITLQHNEPINEYSSNTKSFVPPVNMIEHQKETFGGN